MLHITPDMLTSQPQSIEAHKSRLVELLAGHATVKIATASAGSAPWVATAFFAEDDEFSLVVMLEARGRTLTNIRANPRVALMIEDGDAMALFAQADGLAKIVVGAGDRFREAIAGKTPESAPLVSLPDQVPVRIRLMRWKLTDVPGGWIPARELICPPKLAEAG